MGNPFKKAFKSVKSLFKAPKQPDFRGSAVQQAQLSQQAANFQARQNRPDQIGPSGSIKWAQDPNNPEKWTQTTSLDPTVQAAVDAQKGQLSQYGTPMDFGRGLTSAFGFGDSADWRQKGQDAVMKLQAPMLRESREALENQLANQGVARGDKAWNREMMRQDDAEARAGLQAIDAGRRESAQLFDEGTTSVNQANQIQGQEFNQNMIKRMQPINERNALLARPDASGFVAAGRGEAANLTGAAQDKYGANIDQYNNRQGNMQNAAALFFSDARLKEDIQYTGDSIGGVPVVYYRYRGLPGRRIGVIAQDVLRVKPGAVALHPSGFLVVNYSELF